MPTPHIEAKKGDFAKVVLMPGDPKRAKLIADTFLVDAKLVSDVRGICAYTGKTKNGVKISVMASGMGIPSISIYSHELYCEYGVETIIRVGTCGSYVPNEKLLSVYLVNGASTDSNCAAGLDLRGTFSATADFDSNVVAYNTLKEDKIPFKVGNILSGDLFYGHDADSIKKWSKVGVLGVEMESYGLFLNASVLKKKALCLLTVSDCPGTNKKVLTSQERQNGLMVMLKEAVKIAEKLSK